MSETTQLTELKAGTRILFGGNQVSIVSEELAARFKPGDRLIVMQNTGDLLHIPEAQYDIARAAVGRAHDAFARMASVPDEAISKFYDEFASRLADEGIWSKIKAVNEADVERAKARGRSTTRLVATDKMRDSMIEGLRGWRDTPPSLNKVQEHVAHEGWTVEQIVAPLGVVGFVFEGRPNVFADATGVLRGGNTVVFRIGSDALGSARAIDQFALAPALEAAGLPAGATSLIDSEGHAAGWAMFADSRLSLAVARGSGKAVEQLGGVARQSGIPVSLHGTGGAWLIADETANGEDFSEAVYHSLDRKVCNTLNVCCLPRGNQALLSVFIAAVVRAGKRRGEGGGFKLHIVQGDEGVWPAALFSTRTQVVRADGVHQEMAAETLPLEGLAWEWEWEETPEVTVKLVDSTDEAVQLFNRYSPQFVASLISTSAANHKRFYETVNAPFVGNGFTRWVDGQYALDRPELGLSNWQGGRLFTRGGILSGDGVYTLRTRVRQSDPSVHR